MKTGETRGKILYIRLLTTIALLIAMLHPIALYAEEAELAAVRAAIQAKGAEWVAGENAISQLPPEERKQRLGALIDPKALAAATPDPRFKVGITPGLTGAGLPTSLDWRNNGGNFVTPVRNQGQCGSCWAFSSTAAFESAALRYFNKPGKDINFSEQIVLSCTPPDNSANNCNGGYVQDAAAFLTSYGVGREGCYPYTQANGICTRACLEYPADNYKLSGWSWVGTWSSPDVTTIKNALNISGPLVTTFQVYDDFYYYQGGVYRHTWGYWDGGHAVLIVGYNDIGNGYFIVKNSWGADWGESGYFRIAYSEVSAYVSYINNKTQFGVQTIAYGTVPVPAAPGVTPSLPASTTSSSVAESLTITSGVPWKVRTSSGATWTAWQTIPGSDAVNVSLGAANGSRDVFMEVRDYAGRITPIAHSTTLLDNTKPTGNVKINGGAATVKAGAGAPASTPVHLDLAMFDNNMASPQMRIKIGATFTAADSGLWKAFSKGDDSVTLSGTGLKTVYVQFMDDYLNKSAVYPASITVSSTGKVWPGSLGVAVSNLQINGGASIITSPTITLTYDVGASSDPLKARYLTTPTWTAWAPITSGTTITKKLILPAGSGPRLVYVQVLDATTGAVTVPMSAWANQDTSGPMGSILINDGNGSVKTGGATTNVNLTLVASDPDTGVTQMLYKQTGATPLPTDPGFVAYATTVTNYPLNTTTTGAKYVYVWYKNNAGKISPRYAASILVTP